MEAGMPASPETASRLLFYSAVAGVLGLAAGLRLVNLGSEWLWYDELLSVTFSRIPVHQLLDPRLPDPHPPLYYLQLRYWLALGNSDVWIVANPIAWSVGAVASLLFAANKIYGSRIALAGAALLAVSPIALMFAHETRMYSMMMFLVIWVWYFNHRFASGASIGPFSVLGMIASESCLLLSHATGPFMVSFVYLYTLLLARQEGTPRSRVVGWGAIHIAIGAAMIPALPYFTKSQAQLLSQGFPYLITPKLSDVVQTLGEILFGLAVSGVWVGLATTLVSLLLLLVAIRSSTSRPLILSLVVAPILAAVSISYLRAPVWHVRTVVFVCPFFALAIARAVWSAQHDAAEHRVVAGRLAVVALGALLAGQLASGIAQLQRHPIKAFNVKQTVAEVRQRLQPGDAIYVPHAFDYWCFAWYFFGPDGHTALTRQGAMSHGDNYVVHGPPRPQLFRDRTVWFGRVSWRPATAIENHSLVDTFGHSGFLVDQHVPAKERARPENEPATPPTLEP
jgi:mannosyltransferase